MSWKIGSHWIVPGMKADDVYAHFGTPPISNFRYWLKKLREQKPTYMELGNSFLVRISVSSV